MHLGISSYTFSWAVGVPGHLPEHPLRLADLIDMAHGYGLSLLQIGDNLPLDKLDMAEREEALRLLKAYQVQLEVGTRGLTDKQLAKYLDIAEFFGSPILRMVIDSDDYQPGEEEIVALIRRWIPELERRRICLAIENHDRFEAKTLARIMRRCASEQVGICLDTANSLGALEGVETVTNELVPYTVNLHIKDVAIRRLPSQLGFVVTGTPAGKGGIDVRWLIEKVRHNGRMANCILEQWTPYEETIEKTMSLEKAGADESIAFLKAALGWNRSAAQGTVFGASAAYTISRAGALFTVDDICLSMRELSQDGFTCYQPELSFVHALQEWENGGIEKVNACQRETGICIKQLICHFALDFFQTEEKVRADVGYKEMERFLAIANRLEHCTQILLPIGPLTLGQGPITAGRLEQLQAAYFNKLGDFSRMIQREGLAVSFELLPGNFIGTYDALFDAMSHQGLKDFGINFDTGHAIANGEDIYRLAREYAPHMRLTHLGDPSVPGGTKHSPGQGMVDWARLIRLLLENGYCMALDLEIMASADSAREEYRSGLQYLQKVVQAAAKELSQPLPI